MHSPPLRSPLHQLSGAVQVKVRTSQVELLQIDLLDDHIRGGSKTSKMAVLSKTQSFPHPGTTGVNAVKVGFSSNANAKSNTKTGLIMTSKSLSPLLKRPSSARATPANPKRGRRV